MALEGTLTWEESVDDRQVASTHRTVPAPKDTAPATRHRISDVVSRSNLPSLNEKNSANQPTATITTPAPTQRVSHDHAE